MGLTHGLVQGLEFSSKLAWHGLEECGSGCFSPAALTCWPGSVQGFFVWVFFVVVLITRWGCDALQPGGHLAHLGGDNDRAGTAPSFPVGKGTPSLQPCEDVGSTYKM